jgi:hypothetical protein
MVRRDQVGTPAQRCGNSDGDKSRRLLVDAAQRRSPLAQKYLEDEPQAGALLLEQAQRRLRRAGRGPRRALRDAPGRAAVRRSQPRRRARRGVRALLAVGRRADGGAAVEGAPRAVGGVFAAGSVRASRCRHLPAGRRSGGGDAGDAHRAAAGADPRRGGRRRSWCCCRPSATAASPPASRTWRGSRLDAAPAGVRRPVVAIERVAELEQIR